MDSFKPGRPPMYENGSAMVVHGVYESVRLCLRLEQEEIEQRGDPTQGDDAKIKGRLRLRVALPNQGPSSAPWARASEKTREVAVRVRPRSWVTGKKKIDTP